MANDEFDSIETADGQHRWVWNNPESAEQRVGPGLHPSRRAAIRAGKQWLAAKQSAR